MVSPFTLTVYDRALYRRGTVGAPLSVKVTARHNALGTAEFTVPVDHPRAADLLATGARVVVGYERLTAPLLSGPIVSVAGERGDGALTCTVQDDFRVLLGLLAWPLPGAALTAQTVAYDVRTGSQETVTKGVVVANANRAGIGLTAATDLGRGSTVTVSWRFHPILDRLLPALTLGLTVRQRPDVRQGDGRYRSPGLLLDVYVPRTYARTLTDTSGVIADWKYARAAPVTTRVVLGAQGEATARTFASSTDATAETAWGMVQERFIDARDTSDAAVTAQRSAEALSAGAANSGLSVTLAETTTFRYGDSLRVGDLVTLQVTGQAALTDVLTEASLSWTADQGVVVTPIVGDLTDPTFTLARTVAALVRAVTDLKAGR